MLWLLEASGYPVHTIFKYTRTLHENGAVIFIEKPEQQTLRCPACKSHDIIRKDMIRYVSIRRIAVYIKVAVQQGRYFFAELSDR